MEMPPLATEFLEACLAPDLDRAQALVKEHPDLSAEHPVVAGVCGSPKTLAHFLEEDSSVVRTPAGPRNWQPLFYLAFSWLHRREPERRDDIARCARLFIEHGADPNARWMPADGHEGGGWSPLYGAVGVTFNPALARVLLDAGANPNDGESLYHACETGGSGNTECLQMLYEHGLDRDALAFCVKHAVDYLDHGKVAWFLEHGADPNADPVRSCLGHAILRRSSPSLLELILDAGADPNARWSGERPLLALAARLADGDAFELLERRGAIAELDEVDRWMLALGRADAQAVHAGAHLLDTIPVDQDSTGFTLAGTGVLSQLASGGNRASIALALDVGWDVHAAGWMNGTPLHHAALRGREATVALLLDRGADVLRTAGDRGETPLEWARWGVGLPADLSGDYARTFKLLLDAGADGSAVRPTGVLEVDVLLGRVHE